MADREIDVFNLSFIDLLSCALGGILLLLLLFASLLRGQVEQVRKAEAAVGGNVREPRLSEGEEIPPAEPMVVIVSHVQPVSWPLEVRLHHPRILADGKLDYPDPARCTGGLTWDQSSTFETIGLEGGGSPKAFWRALFSRKPYRKSGARVTALIPNSRSLISDQRKSQVGEAQRGDGWADHQRFWVIGVSYPSGLTPAQSRQLDNLEQLRRRVMEAELTVIRYQSRTRDKDLKARGQAGTFHSPWPVRLSQGRLRDFLPAPGEESPLEEIFRNKVMEQMGLAALGPDVPLGFPAPYLVGKDPDSEYRTFVQPVKWQTPKGLTASGEGLAKDRADQFHQLWFQGVFPALKELHAARVARPEGTALPVGEYLKAYTRIESFRTRLNNSSRGGKPLPLTWQDDLRVLGECFETQTPGHAPETLGTFLLELKTLADRFAGTAFDAPESVGLQWAVRAPGQKVPRFVPVEWDQDTQKYRPADATLRPSETLYLVFPGYLEH